MHYFFTATITVYQNPTLCPKGVLFFYFVILIIASKSFSRYITCHHLPQGGDVTAGGCLSGNGYIVFTVWRSPFLLMKRNHWYLSKLRFRYKILNGTFSSINQNNTELLVIGPEETETFIQTTRFKPIRQWNIDWGVDTHFYLLLSRLF